MIPELAGVSFDFWICPDCPNSQIEWKGTLATCQICGRTNEDAAMKDGTFTFYTLQHRTTHRSPWLKPNEPLELVEDHGWSFSSWDVFGGTAEPWHGSGNDYRPKYRVAHDETHSVWANTGWHGWWSLEYAVKGLRRVRAADAKGKFDVRDRYRHHEQAVRHEFRLVKVTVSKKTEVLTPEEVMEALVPAEE